ncbi:MAG: hypothetical protein PHS92_03790 [Candidatus Gracilibacteria bacterium]|nr:hypothetical protein [Candidatus Gracilibacteria bacterium]
MAGLENNKPDSLNKIPQYMRNKKTESNDLIDEKSQLNSDTKGKLNEHAKLVGVNSTALEYSKEQGYMVNVRIQVNPNGSSSLLIDGQLGEKQKGLLAAYGMQIGNNMQIMGFVEGLGQNRTFGSTGEKYDVSQGKAGLNFRISPEGVPFLRSIDTKITHSISGNKTVSEHTEIVDYGTFIDTIKIHNGFIGAQETQALISGTFNVGQGGEIIASAGTSSLRYNDGQSKNTPGAGLKYTQYMDLGQAFAEVNKSSSETSFGVGYKGNIKPISGATWEVNAKQINGENYKDSRITAGINIPFGGDIRTSKIVRPEGIGEIGDNLGNFVDSSKSSHVLGKEVTTVEHTYSEKPGENYGQGPTENYGQLPSENYGQLPVETYGQIAPENYGQKIPENYGQIAPESYGETIPELY